MTQPGIGLSSCIAKSPFFQQQHSHLLICTVLAAGQSPCSEDWHEQHRFCLSASWRDAISLQQGNAVQAWCQASPSRGCTQRWCQQGTCQAQESACKDSANWESSMCRAISGASRRNHGNFACPWSRDVRGGFWWELFSYFVFGPKALKTSMDVNNSIVDCPCRTPAWSDIEYCIAMQEPWCSWVSPFVNVCFHPCTHRVRTVGQIYLCVSKRSKQRFELKQRKEKDVPSLGVRV